MEDGSDSTHRAKPLLSMIVTLAVVFGVGLILSAIWLSILVPTVMYVIRAHHAEGVYEGSDARIGGTHGGTFLHPGFRFVTPRGEVVEFVTRSGSTDQPYADGQKVDVLYDPARPTDARLNSFFEVWAAPVFAMIFALPPLLIPVYLFFAARRRR